jgi:hypothetical protein
LFIDQLGFIFGAEALRKEERPPYAFGEVQWPTGTIQDSKGEIIRISSSNTLFSVRAFVQAILKGELEQLI